MCSQCNNSSNENGPSKERTEREAAVAAELVRTLFWTSGRTTTGSSAGRSEAKTASQNRLVGKGTWTAQRSVEITKDAGLVNVPAGSLLDGL